MLNGHVSQPPSSNVKSYRRKIDINSSLTGAISNAAMMNDPIADAKTQEATHQYIFRNATPDDIPALQQMIGDSLRALGKGYYTQAELDGSIGYLFGPDSVLVADQ
jgi:hypothetical protein